MKKKIVLILFVCFAFSGCTTYEKSVRNQLNHYGYEADSTKLVIKKGKPACRYTYHEFDSIYKEYDQVLRYRDTDPIPESNIKFKILYFWRDFFWIDYFFKNGLFVKRRKVDIKTLADWICDSK